MFASPTLLGLLLLLGNLLSIALAAISSMSYKPKGVNPLLYDPGLDPIMHLDADTFADTVFNPTRDRAFLVEFYKDWCGYCRRLVPFYKQLADTVQHWPFVQVAVINCADAYNAKICHANNIPTVPKLKYFPRTATTFDDGQVIEHTHSAMDMRKKLHQKILDDFLGSKPREGIDSSEHCNLDMLCRQSLSSMSSESNESSEVPIDKEGKIDPWKDVPSVVSYQTFVFEDSTNKGTELPLKLLLYKPQTSVRRILVKRADQITVAGKNDSLPFVVILKRGESVPLLAETLNEQTVPKIAELLSPMIAEINETEARDAHKKPHISALDCSIHSDKCRSMFFVSEIDMLKAVRTALLDEVISSAGDWLDGEKFMALYNFLGLLIKRFPQRTKHQSIVDGGDGPGLLSKELEAYQHDEIEYYQHHPKAVPISSPTITAIHKLADRNNRGKVLTTSERAVRSIQKLKALLETKMNDARTSGHISLDEWKEAVENAESAEGNPFHMDAPWEHCKGSSPLFRGFTCGLWTTFHTLAVNSYLSNEDSPLEPLSIIQQWVNSFFSCSGCRRHFMDMTTRTFPMGEALVKQPEDSVIYLWRAHNIVNQRLHGDETTEDPQFPKEKFPPTFVCQECRSLVADNNAAVVDGFDRAKTFAFLLRFAQQIRPFDKADATKTVDDETKPETTTIS